MREPGYYWVRSKTSQEPRIGRWVVGDGWSEWVLAPSFGGARKDVDFDFIGTERLMPPDMPAKE
jgi:hypothetical protein